MKKFLAIISILAVSTLSPHIANAAKSACGGNLVWIDTNGDGVKTPDEKGLRGAQVSLLDYYGQTLDKLTSSNGYFKLCAPQGGLYQLSVEVPDGYRVTTQWQGNSQYHDSDADLDGRVDVELKLGKNITKYDIGLIPSSITLTEAINPTVLTTPSASNTTPNKPTAATAAHSVDFQYNQRPNQILFGPWVEVRHRNDGVFGTFNSALLSATTGTVLEILSDAQLTGTTTILQLGSAGEWGWNFSNNTSKFTMKKWKRSVDRFANDPEIYAAIQAGIQSGLIRTFHLVDEPHHRRWSPTKSYNHITNADLDEMAKYVKAYWPNAKTAVRASPRTLVHYQRSAHDWQYLDEAFLMINYRKWASNGAGTIEAFMEREIAEANRQGLGLIGSVQMLIGAPKSDQRFWPHRGNGPKPTGKLKVSPLELTTYVDAFLTRRNAKGKIDPNGQILFDTVMVFRWDRNKERDWQNDYYRSTISELIGQVQNY